MLPTTLPDFDAEEWNAEQYQEFTSDTVKIDPVDLNREFCELPPRLAYWNAKLAQFTERAMAAKVDYETERARVLLETREELRVEKAKVTVDEVNATVALNDEVVDAQMVYIAAEADRLRAKGIVDAILCKRDMVQSLGAKLRAEMMGDPVLRTQLAGATGIEFNEE